ncbi:hypothetical protein LZ30DRAFT_744147 [Colletotrichum cereale]|nr:hypothetical protein LZ30DRAFT_744147 [Colletotrichum cereale]
MRKTKGSRGRHLGVYDGIYMTSPIVQQPHGNKHEARRIDTPREPERDICIPARPPARRMGAEGRMSSVKFPRAARCQPPLASLIHPFPSHVPVSLRPRKGGGSVAEAGNRKAAPEINLSLYPC